MEEVDQVGEVDFSFDLANWMLEENDEDDLDSEESMEESSAQVDPATCSPTQIPKSVELRAPKTPTISKILEESRQVTTALKPPSSTYTFGKAGAKNTRAQLKTVPAKPGHAQPKGGPILSKSFSQTQTKNMPLKGAKVEASQEAKVRPSTGIQQKAQANLSEKVKNVKNTRSAAPKRDTKAEIVSSSSEKISTSIAALPSATSRTPRSVTASSNVTHKQAESGVKPTASPKPLQSKANDQKSPYSEAQTKSTVPKKMNQVKLKTTSTPPVKPIQSELTVSSSSLEAQRAKPQTHSAVSSKAPQAKLLTKSTNPLGAKAISTAPSKPPPMGVVSNTPEKKGLKTRVSLTEASTKSVTQSKPLLRAEQSTSLTSAVTIQSKLVALSQVKAGTSEKSISGAKTGATESSKPTTEVLKPLAVPEAVGKTSNPVKKISPQIKPKTITTDPSKPPTTAAASNIAKNEGLKTKVSSTGALKSVAQSKPLVTTEQSSMILTTPATTQSHVQAAASSKPTTEMIKPVAKSEFLGKTSITVTKNTSHSVSSKCSPTAFQESKDMKRQDRESSPCIAEVMALDASKNGQEDKNVHEKMTPKDVFDSGLGDMAEDNVRRTNSLNKRPTSSIKTGPPDKKAKIDVSPKASTSVEVKVNNATSASTVKPNENVTPAPTTTNTKVVTKHTVKRIIRRFHRSSQTEIKQHCSKLLQCLIRVPALDAPQKPKNTVSVSANLISEDQQSIFYVSPLPATVSEKVFEAVSLFNTNQVGARQIQAVSFTHGICIGHITQAEMDKSLFRENIVAKSSFYNFQFDGQDGIMDLYFKDEDTFQAAMTQIRKTKIGPRYLPVSFFKVLADRDQDRMCPKQFARATVIFDQNFSSSAFLAYSKAQIWNKPKVEETFSVHNMPGGIPLDFLKQLIPDAITIEVDEDESPKFTQEGSRVLVGVNRKTGDHILKLFSQVYINRHCLVLTRGRTNEADAPNLREIRAKQMEDYRKVRPSKELKASAKDINRGFSEKSKHKALYDGAEILMQVDDVPDADKVLVGRAGGWKGPSTITHLRQAESVQSVPGQPNSECLKELENPQQDLSDISDGSDIGESPEQENRRPVLQRVSKPRSVKSRERDSSPLREKTGFSRGHSKDSFRNLSDRAHNPQRNTDIFGRSQEMRGRYADVEQQESVRYVQRIESGKEKSAPQQEDLRHFITVQRKREDERGNEKSAWERKTIDDLAFKRNTGESGRNEARRNLGRDSADKTSSGRRSPRYSPEMEWMLCKTDREKNIRAEIMNKGDKERTVKAVVRRSRSPIVRQSRSPSPRLDSRDRFRRLVEEKLRGLEDYGPSSVRQKASNYSRGRDRDDTSLQALRPRHSRERDFDSDRTRDRLRERERSHSKGSGSDLGRGRREKNRSPQMQRVRARSPQASHLRRRTSASPVHKMRGITKDDILLQKDRESKVVSKPDQTVGRKVTIVRRRSLSPVQRRNLGKGRSSLSPISIGDEDDEEDGKRSKGEAGRKGARRDPEWLFKLSGFTEESKPAQSLVSSRTQAPASSAGDDSDDTSGLQREVLHEFVKQLLESANLATSSSAEDSSVNIKTTSSVPDTRTSHHGHHHHHHHQEQQLQQQAHRNQSQPFYSSDHLATQQRVEPKMLLHSDGQTGVGAPIPPPIPPPIMPPLLDSAPAPAPASASEKMSHLESLAQQLAADIQRQQPQQQQVQQQQQLQEHMNPPQHQYQEAQLLSDGMWSAQPPPRLSQAQPPLLAMRPPHLVLNAPPPAIAFTAPPMSTPQPVVPLPFFTSMANQIRLQAVPNTTGQAQNPNSTNVYRETNLNPHGNFF